jgi:hypothetical protein
VLGIDCIDDIYLIIFIFMFIYLYDYVRDYLWDSGLLTYVLSSL